MKKDDKMVWLDDEKKEYYFNAQQSDIDIMIDGLKDGMILRVVNKEQHLSRSARRSRVNIADWLKALKKKGE